MTEVIRTVAELRARVAAARRDGGRIGLVPTMGALHEGHLDLVRAAAAASDLVIVSVFVNPSQFNNPGDLERYPRDLDGDAALAASAGAHVVFAPPAGEVYPEGFATSIRVSGVTERWEGAARGAAHFDGVATVVTKLLTMAAPDAAWFGRKDAQQLAVVRRLVADLDLPVEIHGVPTRRASDGLALSSRNARLATADRERALALHASLAAARAAAAAGATDAHALAATARGILDQHGIDPEYWAIVDAATFEPLDTVRSGALAIVAAFVGDVRLIDNVELG